MWKLRLRSVGVVLALVHGWFVRDSVAGMGMGDGWLTLSPVLLVPTYTVPPSTSQTHSVNAPFSNVYNTTAAAV